MQSRRKRIKKQKTTDIAEEDPYVRHAATNFTTHVIEIDFSKNEGEAELHDTVSDDGQDSYNSNIQSQS